MTLTGTDPSVVAELKRLAEASGGQLRPAAVVDAARPDTSPLHRSFEWDDSEAAEQWRLQQARMLIRATVTYEPVGDGKLVPCRVFVSLTPDRLKGGDGYKLTSTVLTDVQLRQQLLADARAEMLRFKDKYRQLSELAAVFEAINRATEQELAHTA